MDRQRGASGAFILVILALVMVGILAVSAMRRTGTNITDRETTTARLSHAAEMLDAYAGEAGRLPCPADPTLDTGDADPIGASVNCNSAQGTLPWRTIGLARAESIDAWGRKISYRVYSGADGLTQAGGASMVDCDTIEAFPIAIPPNGLCPGTHDMKPAQFLQGTQQPTGKGLPVTDLGVVHNDAAYVLVSHGPSGLGGYTASGAQMDMPAGGDERDNTRATGPFTIKAFSDPDTAVNTGPHFDDLLAYRSLADLVKRANLAARDWPDPPPPIVSAVTFDQPTLSAALGHSPASDTGQSSIAFTGATVSAFNTSGSQDVSFLTGSTESIGGVSGGGNDLASTGGEGLQIDFAVSAQRFAMTLDDFGYQATLFGFPIYIEQAELRFYTVSGATATLVSTVTEFGCNPDGGLASFSVDVGSDFNRVEIRPKPTLFFGTASSFSLAEMRACLSGVTCATALATPANTCS